MKLATFNIFWLGNEEFPARAENQLGHEVPERNDNDWRRIAQVVSKLNPDVIVFEEIVNLNELQTVLRYAGEATQRSFRIYDGNNLLLGNGTATGQKIVIAFDEQSYDLLAASSIYGNNARLPFAVRVRNKDNQGEVLVIGVHFKSGQPLFDDSNSASIRRGQCQHLADWVAGNKAALNPVFPKPLPGERIVILGDFNALYELEEGQPNNWQIIVDSLGPLRQAQMENWSWEKPLTDSNYNGKRSTSYIERLLIDYVMLSPSLENHIVQRPAIYSYDNDPQIVGDSANNVRYRVSDHRPVWVEIDITS